MNKQQALKIVVTAGTLAMLVAAQAATTMTKAQYKEEGARISASYDADKGACHSLAGNAKDVCIEEAKAKEKIARAQLEYSYSGKAKDHYHVLVDTAEANYAVAKEKCDDKAGNAKDVCVKEAKAAETTALADAKEHKEIHKARKDAAADTRDADYSVAKEKCDALAGEAKDNCLAAAKTKFGKD